MKQNLNQKLNRKTIMLINIVLAQALVVVINGLWGVYASSLPINIPLYYVTAFSLLAGVVLAFAAMFMINEIFRLSKKESEAEYAILNLKKNEELIKILRIQRHDFLNHLQVIYGLVHLKKIDKLSSYIGELTNDLETESMLSNLAFTELAAFLLKKKSSAIEQGIRFDIDIFTDLSHAKFSANELVRITGNLIDNAFYAIRENPHNDSAVLLTIDEEKNNYIISVANTGNEIPYDLKEKIFKQGFTTKGEKGSGLGLHIVRELVCKNNGTVQLVDEPGFSVCFQVTIPIKKYD